MQPLARDIDVELRFHVHAHLGVQKVRLKQRKREFLKLICLFFERLWNLSKLEFGIWGLSFVCARCCFTTDLLISKYEISCFEKF
jgi:hypothetical protein